MIISAIVAYSQNFCIGKEGKVPWHLPADLKDFKNKTLGHVIVMGRKTFQSIGKALPARPNVVLSKGQKIIETVPNPENPDNPESVQIVENPLPQAENLFFYDNFTEVINFAQEQGETELFVIGGGEIYKHLLPFCHKVYATEVRTLIPDGDTFFPDLSNFENWTLVQTQQHQYDDRNPFDYKFMVWENNAVLPYI